MKEHVFLYSMLVIPEFLQVQPQINHPPDVSGPTGCVKSTVGLPLH